MKKQMMKVTILLTVSAMLLAGCGVQGDKSGETNKTSTDVKTEIKTDVDENEVSLQDNVTDQKEADLVDSEVDELEAASEDGVDAEEKEAEEHESQEPKEPQEPEEPKRPEEPKKPTHEHKYTGVVTKEPGCYYARKDGEMTYTCSCGDSYVEVLEFLPCSDLSDGIRVTVREPDCQHQGRTCEHCKYCGQELYPGTLPETEHVPSEWLEIPSQGKKCKVCVNCGITLEKELLEQIESMMKMVLR